jgi:hypothetical protein
MKLIFPRMSNAGYIESTPHLQAPQVKSIPSRARAIDSTQCRVPQKKKILEKKGPSPATALQKPPDRRMAPSPLSHRPLVARRAHLQSLPTLFLSSPLLFASPSFFFLPFLLLLREPAVSIQASSVQGINRALRLQLRYPDIRHSPRPRTLETESQIRPPGHDAPPRLTSSDSPAAIRLSSSFNSPNSAATTMRLLAAAANSVDSFPSQ